MSQLGDENKVVRDTLVDYAVQQGWQYLSPTEASQLRGNPNQPFLEDLLAAQLLKLNPGCMTPGLAREIIHRLHRLSPTPGGNHEAWKYLAGSQSIYSPEHKREFDIIILDRQEGNNLRYPNHGRMFKLMSEIYLAPSHSIIKVKKLQDT